MNSLSLSDMAVDDTENGTEGTFVGRGKDATGGCARAAADV